MHVEQLGEWVGSLEVNSTNHVLAQMGCDLCFYVFDPLSNYIMVDEQNIRADGKKKPIIIVISIGGHYEWLRMRDSHTWF